MIPTDITNCALWLSAEHVPGATPGGAVSTWADRSGNANDASQATSGLRPTLLTNQLNGRPVLRFDGLGGYLATPSIASAGDECTIGFVFRSRGNPLYPQVLLHLGDDINDAGTWRVLRSGADDVAGRVQVWVEAANYSGQQSSVTRAYRPVVVLARIDRSNSAATEVDLYVDGVQQTVHFGLGDASGNVASEVIYIGGLDEAALGYNQTAQMDLAEVVYYTRRVTDQERDDLLEYLSTWADEPDVTGSGERWAVVLRALGGGWARKYSPSNPQGVNNLEAIIDRSGGCARGRFTGPYGLAPSYPCVGEIWIEGQRVFMGVVISTPARYPGDGEYQLEGLRWLLDRSYNLERDISFAESSSTPIGSYIAGHLADWMHYEITVPAGLSSQGGSVTQSINLGVESGSIGATIDALAASSGDRWGVDADGQVLLRSPDSAINQVAYAPPAILQWSPSSYGNRVGEVVAAFGYYGQIYQVATAQAEDALGGVVSFISLQTILADLEAIEDIVIVDDQNLNPNGAPADHIEVSLGQTTLASANVTITPSSEDSNGNYWQYQDVVLRISIDGEEIAASSPYTVVHDTVTINVDLQGLQAGSSVVIRLDYTPDYTNDSGTPTNAQADIGYGHATITVGQFNSAFADAAAEACAAQLALLNSGGEVADVTVPDQILPLTDTVTIRSTVEQIEDYIGEVAELAYRCSTDAGIQTVIALGAALRPPAVIRTIELMQDVQRNPKRRRV